MSITYSCKTKARASLKLYNQIVSYLFEQELDELKGKEIAKEALTKAKEELAKIVKGL